MKMASDLHVRKSTVAAEGRHVVFFLINNLKITFVFLGNYGNGISGSEGKVARDKEIH